MYVPMGIRRVFHGMYRPPPRASRTRCVHRQGFRSGGVIGGVTSLYAWRLRKLNNGKEERTASRLPFCPFAFSFFFSLCFSVSFLLYSRMEFASFPGTESISGLYRSLE